MIRVSVYLIPACALTLALLATAVAGAVESGSDELNKEELAPPLAPQREDGLDELPEEVFVAVDPKDDPTHPVNWDKKRKRRAWAKKKKKRGRKLLKKRKKVVKGSSLKKKKKRRSKTKKKQTLAKRVGQKAKKKRSLSSSNRKKTLRKGKRR